jgi:lipoprotein-anchoring transpeptidase ErfK/SrfK
MVDYYSILTRAVASLAPNTSEKRSDLYNRARTTLLDKLRAVDPTLSDPALKAERAALEAAIQRIEREALLSSAPPRPAQGIAEARSVRRYRDRPPLRDTRKSLRIVAGALGAVFVLAAGGAIYSFWPRNIADLRNIASPRAVTAVAEEPNGRSGYVNLRQLVYYRTNQPVGTIIVDKTQTFLYVVRPNTSALRYSIGVGSECITLAGLFHVVRKESTDSAARVIYLDKDYRIHGSAAPVSGATAGCIRLDNEDVIYLYDRTPLESRVVVSN